MRKIFRRLRAIWRGYDEDDEKCQQNSVPGRISGYYNLHNHERTIRFVITNADGGYIISFDLWDGNEDKNIGGTYVRPGDCDIGKEVAHILTLESLKKK